LYLERWQQTFDPTQTIRQIFSHAEDLADFFWRFAGK